jgi:hypothetical protein
MTWANIQRNFLLAQHNINLQLIKKQARFTAFRWIL